MNPITIIYKLKLKGYNLQTLADEFNTSRQHVRLAVYGNPQRGKVKEIRKRIDEILS